MRRAKFVIISILLLFSMTGAFASVATRPYISAWFGGVFCHPTAEYLKEYPGDSTVETPEFRTSYSFGFDFNIVDVSIIFDKARNNSLNLDLGLSTLNISESIPFGISILKPYNSFGLVVGVGYSFNSTWSLDMRYRYLECIFKGSKTKFLAHEFELAPSYRIASADILNIRISLPVDVLIKADAISFRTSIAMTIQFDSARLKRSAR